MTTWRFGAVLALAFAGPAGPALAQASDVVCDRCVGTSDIDIGAVTTGRLSDNAVSAPKLRDGAVTKNKIAPNAVTGDKIAFGAVKTGRIADDAVTAPKLRDGAVTQAKLHASVVTNPATPIDSCGTITQPGSYVLTRNLNASGNCIRIDADDVTLDLAGYRLSGNGSGDGVDENDTIHSNITVLNGTVTGFQNGVDLNQVIGSVAISVRAIDNANAGIAVASSIVKDSVVIGNGGNGIHGVSFGTITGNQVFDNGGNGIVAAQGSVVTNNSVRGNDGIGISASFGVIVRGNAVSANGGFGIAASTDSAIIENAANGNASGNYAACASCTFANNGGM